jgi:probable rRNA maturation factor
VPIDLTVRRSAALRRLPVDARRLEREIGAALDVLGLSGCELSVLLCDDAFMQPLNLQWRGYDAPTDVLSFPQEDLSPTLTPDAEEPPVPTVLGDVVISVETAARQADELGHDLITELVVLAVHGLLHLLGHDHERDAAEAARMAAEEDRVLTALRFDRQAALIRRAR